MTGKTISLSEITLTEIAELRMRYNSDHFKTLALKTRLRVFLFVVLYFLVLPALPFCPGCLPDTSPPDLSSCTHIEIQYGPSTLDYVIPGTSLQNVLSSEEKKYIQSLKTFVVTDQECIKAFAHDVSLGSYKGYRPFTRASHSKPVYVDCYRNEKLVISFTVLGKTIITNNHYWFEYPRGLPNLEIIEPPEVKPFKLRKDCAWNMEKLYVVGSFHPKFSRLYPEPNQWCNATVTENAKRKSYPRLTEEELWQVFRCPAGGEGKCHYAMNPNCEPNSPPDTVLLFETKAGWNQHGGPELFTFDNHEPKGGCVLLNDGTIKFIRTKEELHQLRWK